MRKRNGSAKAFKARTTSILISSLYLNIVILAMTATKFCRQPRHEKQHAEQRRLKAQLNSVSVFFARESRHDKTARRRRRISLRGSKAHESRENGSAARYGRADSPGFSDGQWFVDRSSRFQKRYNRRAPARISYAE